MDRWTEIELFVQVAETGSLSRAAEALNLSNASASRHLAALEDRLGARLVERNTRRLYLTDTGQEFFQRARGILADLRDAESTVNAAALNPTGTLRISASLSFSLHHIAPLLREYTERYPNVTVHVEAANRYLDIIDNNIDVAIRNREYEPDSNITIRRLAGTRRILVAAPAYLSKHGVPREIEDLITLPGVGRKTANVLRSVVFGLPGLPVDTHVGRLSRRLGLTKLEDPVKVEYELNAMLPPPEWGEFSLRLILHGRRVCDARTPRCEECLLEALCPSSMLPTKKGTGKSAKSKVTKSVKKSVKPSTKKRSTCRCPSAVRASRRVQSSMACRPMSSP